MNTVKNVFPLKCRLHGDIDDSLVFVQYRHKH